MFFLRMLAVSYKTNSNSTIFGPKSIWGVRVGDLMDFYQQLLEGQATWLPQLFFGQQVECGHDMGMDQYLLIPFLGGWTDEHPFTSYFDVHQGYKVLTHCHMTFHRRLERIESWLEYGNCTEHGPMAPAPLTPVTPRWCRVLIPTTPRPLMWQEKLWSRCPVWTRCEAAGVLKRGSQAFEAVWDRQVDSDSSTFYFMLVTLCNLGHCFLPIKKCNDGCDPFHCFAVRLPLCKSWGPKKMKHHANHAALCHYVAIYRAISAAIYTAICSIRITESQPRMVLPWLQFGTNSTSLHMLRRHWVKCKKSVSLTGGDFHGFSIFMGFL